MTRYAKQLKMNKQRKKRGVPGIYKSYGLGIWIHLHFISEYSPNDKIKQREVKDPAYH